jgi:5-methylcytosine-specific restriction enzyme subunit McrC
LTVIELQEGASPIECPLDDATGRALAASGIVKASPDPYLSGVWRIAADRHVGVAVVTASGGAAAPLVTVRIAPKVHINRLFFLLGYALNPRGWREDQIDVAEHTDLLPALAHTFERQAEHATRLGLLQGYRHTQDSAMVVRGRIREGEQLRRRYGAALPVEIEYDEYTTDIAENQILRAAVERLLRLPGVSGSVRRRLLHQRFRLAEVTPPAPGQSPTWAPSRLNARYVPALRLAEIVLRGGSVDHDAGAVRINGFLFDMAKVFEDFVTIAVRECLTASAADETGAGASGFVTLQARHHLDEADTVLMKPDLVCYDADRSPLAVVDAKYKAEKPDGFPGADLYQLLAY